MKKKKNDKDRLKEQSLIRGKLLANRKRRRIAREIVPLEIDLDQMSAIRITRPGKKWWNRQRKNGKQSPTADAT